MSKPRGGGALGRLFFLIIMNILIPPEMDPIIEYNLAKSKYFDILASLQEVSEAYNFAGRYADIDHARQWQARIIELTNLRDLMAEHMDILAAHIDPTHIVTLHTIA